MIFDRTAVTPAFCRVIKLAKYRHFAKGQIRGGARQGGRRNSFSSFRAGVVNKTALLSNRHAMRCHSGMWFEETKATCALRHGSDETVCSSTGLPSPSKTIVSIPEGVQIVIICPFVGNMSASAAVAFGNRMPRHSKQTSIFRVMICTWTDVPRVDA